MKAASNTNRSGSMASGSLGRSALRQLFESRDLRKMLPALGLSSFLSNVLALALPLIILQILDRVVSNQSLETLAILVLGVLIAIVLEEVLRSINVQITGWLGARFEHNTSVAALDRLMHVPLQRYQMDEPGVHEERILATTKVASFYSGQALLVLFDLPFVAIYPILIYIIGGWLVLVPIAVLLIFTYLILRFGHWMRDQVQKRMIQDDRRLGFLTEVLSGIHSVKTLAMEALMQRRYERLQETNSELGSALIHGNAQASNFGMLFSQLMVVAVSFASAWLVVQGKMTSGGLAACMMLSVRALQPLRNGLSVWMRYQTFVAAVSRLNQIFDMPYDDDTGKPPLPPVTQTLELSHVSLRHKAADSISTMSLSKNVLYGGGKKDRSESAQDVLFAELPQRSELFSDICLKVEVKQCVAILGGSGSGKSSLLSMINGMTQPTSGAILLDGHPLTEYAKGSIHREIALLPQTGTIVSGTLLENLTMFDPTLVDEALRLSRRLGLDQIVSGMKLGYETSLAEGVADIIPAGVRQIITVIRALVRKPSVILFDETNVSLDMRLDQLLRDYLAELKGSCTILLVTHRPSYLSIADKKYSLVEGRLYEGVLDSESIAAAEHEDTVIEIADRPQAEHDLAAIIKRQFDEDSDLSACLLPLLKALEWEGPPNELAEAMPHLVRKLDVSAFCATMSNLELFPKSLTGQLNHLDPRLLPCLFVPASRPAMVISKALDNGNFLIFDSQTHTETEIAPDDEIGDFYVFRKNDASLKKRRTDNSWLADVLMRFQQHIVIAFLLTLAIALLALATPLFVRAILDVVLPTSDTLMGTFLLVGTLVAVTVDGLLRNLKSHVIAFVGGRFEFILGNTLFQRIINLPASATDNATVSNQVGRFKNLESLRDFFVGPAALLVFELPSTLVLLLAIAIINPWVLLVILTAIILYTILWFVTRKPSGASVAKSGMLSTARWEFLSEALTDMSTIRSVGANKSWLDRFKDLSGKSVMANYKNTLLHSRIHSLAQILSSLTGLMALAVSAYLAIRGDISSGTMVATMMILWRVTTPLQNIFLAAASVVHIRTSMRQLENLMKIRTEADTGVFQTVGSGTGGSLSFSRVSFRYANDADPALLGISFAVPPGQVVVIAGGNGSGKSTLMKLIERIYVPQAGTIRINNIDIRQLTSADLRARISYMPQNCELFYGTVAQNLRLAFPTASDAELDWAVNMAGLSEDIAAMPQGFNTRISNSKSTQQAHGFRQRLSLARAMLKPAEIVLLDEPGNGLDQKGEEALERCVAWLRGRATVIMVSHRPAHMRMADHVILMHRGSLVAMGTFEKIKDKIMAELI